MLRHYLESDVELERGKIKRICSRSDINARYSKTSFRLLIWDEPILFRVCFDSDGRKTKTLANVTAKMFLHILSCK